ARLSLIENVIFDIETMEDLDASAAQILLEIVEAYHNRNVNVFFVKLRENQKKVKKSKAKSFHALILYMKSKS
ncbi:6940_t:CDS:2, partial [Scutellospora calospora]